MMKHSKVMFTPPKYISLNVPTTVILVMNDQSVAEKLEKFMVANDFHSFLTIPDTLEECPSFHFCGIISLCL